MPAARLVGGGLAAAVRVAAGVLWLLEAATKYRAGFGAADIRRVVESATGNARVPGVYQGLAEALLGGELSAETKRSGTIDSFLSDLDRASTTKAGQ